MNQSSEKEFSKIFCIIPAFVIAVNFLVIAVLVALGWPEWWKNINYELSELTWFSSLQLAFIGASAFQNFVALKLTDPNSPSILRRNLWLLLGMGFFFLSVDEAFQIHERLREGVFKPHNIGTNLPGIGPGDFLLVVYAIVGLFIAYHLFKLIRTTPIALRWFVSAVLLSVVMVLVDAADPTGRSVIHQRIEQFIEEIIETLAQMCFLISFLTFYLSTLKKAFVEKT